MRQVFFLFLALLPACQVHKTLAFNRPTVDVPCAFIEESEGSPLDGPWWEVFEDENLNCLMQKAFEGNLDLAIAWDRLKQAKSYAAIQSANLYPMLDLYFNAIRSKQVKGSTADATVPEPDAFGEATLGTGSGDFIFLNPQISYEMDLWRKIDSLAKASWHQAKASWFDFQATGLVLSGKIADLWFTINEQRQLLALLNEQIKTNETQLELLLLRFSVGESSALDVFQQKVILASTQSDVPPVMSALADANYQLQILTGSPPDSSLPVDAGGYFPELPPLPGLGAPCNLFSSRPDLKAAFEDLWASDYEVAAAVADRFPKLLLFIDYEFSAFDWNKLFQAETLSITANLFQPLIDWGKRKQEVFLRKAIVCEKLHIFSQLFLQALYEIESAIAKEKNQVELIKRLQEQYEYTLANFEESQLRYINGLNDYLTVIAAIQSMQAVERRLIFEKKNLLLYRNELYRALGGNITYR